MASPRTDARVRRVAAKRFEPDEQLVGWTRAWYSRAPRVGALRAISPRYRDIVVLTDRRLMLWEVGSLSRRPRRRVLTDRLDQLTVEDVSRARDGRAIRFSKPEHRAMLLEFGREPSLGTELLARAGRRVDDATPARDPAVEPTDGPATSHAEVQPE